MKKPEEIKKGLECCLSHDMESCESCPYVPITGCARESARDALSLIQQLESKLNQAVEDIRMLGRMGQNVCPVCANYNHGEGVKEKCISCIMKWDTDNFEWRGLKEEDK